MSTLTAASSAWVTDRTRKAGGVYLGLAAVVDGLTGLWLLRNAGGDGAIGWLIGLLVGSLGEFGALASGGAVGTLVGLVAPALGIGLAVIAAVAVLAAMDAYRGFRFRRSAAIALVASLNPLAAPLGLLSVLHLRLARATFASD